MIVRSWLDLLWATPLALLAVGTYCFLLLPGEEVPPDRMDYRMKYHLRRLQHRYSTIGLVCDAIAGVILVSALLYFLFRLA